MTTTTSNITYYDGQTVTVQGLQMRARSYNLPNVIGDNEYAIDFMKGTDWAYAQNGAIDFASSVYHEPDMTFDRPVIDDYGRIFIYNGLYKASLSNNGVVLAQQLYDASTHRLGASNIYLYDYVDTKDLFARGTIDASNITSSNLSISLNATVAGSITANSFIGNGSGLTGLNIPPQTWSSNVATSKIWYNDGNVGIGTSNPSQKLEVIGMVKATAFQGDGSGLTNLPSVSSQWTTNGTSIYYNIGNIGVGTTTPTQSIDVNGNVKANYFIGDGSLLTNLPNGGGGQWSCNVNGDIYYTAGNVGIGLINPAVALSVNGTTSTTTLRTSIYETTTGLLTVKPQTTPANTDLKIDSGGTGNRNAIYFRAKEAFRTIDSEALLRINELGHFTNTAFVSGNVGIGTTIPTQKLDVVGIIEANDIMTPYSLTKFSSLMSMIGNIATNTWTVSTPPNIPWKGVCWSQERSLFVAVTPSGTGGTTRAITSPDGITWTARTTPNVQYQSSCWSPERGLFCAVANSGTGNRAMTSPDGITWTARTTPVDNGWSSVCWSPERGLFCAVALSGTGNLVMTSPDGITWTARTSPVVNGWSSVCWSPQTGLFCAVASTGTGNRVMTSPDGITWTARTSPADNSWNSVCWSPQTGLFCAVASTGTGNRVMTSPDGITWTLRTSPADNSWAFVCWSNELAIFCAVANSGTGNRIMTSPDGIKWRTRTSPADNAWISICFSPYHNMFVATAFSGTNLAMRSLQFI